MNVEQSMCAASGPAAQWEQIDWSPCEQKVSRLQARIVKATQEVFSVNYSFALTTVISPYERHLPPLAADGIFVDLG
jgi:hypothetical protein